MWLWDSCFHSLIWAALGERDRAVAELGSALAEQATNGFVPHVVYYDGFDGHDRFWGTNGTSSITQPPIFGHTIAVLERSGVRVPGVLKQRARRAFAFLLSTRRRTGGGLVEMLHPWESGCDHSPRWDDLFAADSAGRPVGAEAGDPYDEERWYREKGRLVEALEVVGGGAVASESCRIGSVAFNALVAFCADELASVTGDRELSAEAADLAHRVSLRWDDTLATWIDDGPTEDGSGRARTLEALLPLLVERRPGVVERVVEQLGDPNDFSGTFGLRQVHPDEPTFDPDAYWRGASWPQLNYLFEIALTRHGYHRSAVSLRQAGLRGAVESGFSEYWNADDGSGGGARPQSWSGLVITTNGSLNLDG